ncbi:bifunctional hydroxymethylpyrimidine kinase/phosphomethylpyrimidine kinase, partial [Lacticaseibacillus rhamnosus]
RQDAQASDFILLADGSSFWVRSPRIATANTHGTGDTFSACIAAELAKGESLKKAIITAKAFLEGAISQGIFVGHGHGPTNHWATLSEDVQVSAVKSSSSLQG